MKSAGAGGSSGGGSYLSQHATTVKAYARERKLVAAANVFNRWRASGVTMAPMIYNYFLDAGVQCGDMQQSILH